MRKYLLLLVLVMEVAIMVGGYATPVQTPSHVAVPVHVQDGSHTARPQIVVFYATGCPHCTEMEEMLTALLVGHPEIKVARYDINSPGADALLNRLALHYKIHPTQVPVIFVGDKAVVGVGRAQEFALRAAVSDCITRGCSSPLSYVQQPAIPWHDVLWLGIILGTFLLFLVIQG